MVFRTTENPRNRPHEAADTENHEKADKNLGIAILIRRWTMRTRGEGRGMGEHRTSFGFACTDTALLPCSRQQGKEGRKERKDSKKGEKEGGKKAEVSSKQTLMYTPKH